MILVAELLFVLDFACWIFGLHYINSVVHCIYCDFVCMVYITCLFVLILAFLCLVCWLCGWVCCDCLFGCGWRVVVFVLVVCACLWVGWLAFDWFGG